MRKLLAHSSRTKPLVALIYRAAVGPVLTALAYFAGAMIAFLVGTLSDRIFAPFWPPNVILFGALVFARRGRWPLYMLAVLPAHILAEMWVAMPFAQMMIAYVTNVVLAVLAAWMFKLRGPSWLMDQPENLIRILLVAAIAPALAGFGGALVRSLDPSGLHDYWRFWLQWYVGNALAFLTLGPLVVTFREWPRSAPLSPSQVMEAFIVTICIALFGIITIRLGPRLETTAFLPPLLYLPLPFILWAAVRFGATGASGAVLIITTASITATLDGPSVFVTTDIETSVLALQLYLIGIAITVLPLGAAVDEWHLAQRKSRRLSHALLDARDQERRRIARELHDSTGQNLVAAAMIIDQIAPEASLPARIETLRNTLSQSIREIRTLSYLLHPPLLDEGGLRLALQNFADGYTDRTGIVVTMEISIGDGILPKHTELTLFRVIQEALLNISRHSGSKRATVKLTQAGTGQVGRLLVEDAGSGFFKQSGAIVEEVDRMPRGVGLDSMRERMLQIGGQLHIVSGDGGTSVYASFPITRRRRRLSGRNARSAAAEKAGWKEGGRPG